MRTTKAGRSDKILIDHLRNNRGNTSVAAFSTRARAGAPVSVPLSWRELDRLDPAALTLRTVFAKLTARRRDPWRDYFAIRQRVRRWPRDA